MKVTVCLRSGLVLGLLLCPACQKGSQYYPVRGRVLVGGKPAEGALVVFHAAEDSELRALKPSARVEADGSFTLRSYDPQLCPTPADGAPAGEYRVRVSWIPADYAQYRETSRQAARPVRRPEDFRLACGRQVGAERAAGLRVAGYRQVTLSG
jgi:hypothetical protein